MEVSVTRIEVALLIEFITGILTAELGKYNQLYSLLIVIVGALLASFTIGAFKHV